ncbi:THO complex subunit 4A-like [Vicia villosa]|uniref:THO complex subunit 4A-like n=1 Tax=Vicia villosa TaxID=3911 RepID=UPI00273B79E6|nr:THO complex subunit 4A-like [Vicia villosa]
MPAGMDMSLDDIINTTTARRRFTGTHGPNRNVGVRNTIRITPYSIPPSQIARESLRRRSSVDVPETIIDRDAVQTRPITKLYLSNLDDRVSNEDIHLLFSEEGALERYSIHYDQFGRSKGTGEVVFTKQSDALSALKRYNNMKLDGKTLQIELVGIGTSSITPANTPLSQSSILGRPDDRVFAKSSILGRPNDRVFAREERKIGGSRYLNSFTHGGYLPMGHGEEKWIRKVSFRAIGRDFGRYDRRPVEAKRNFQKLSVKDLDEDLDKYHLEAMRISKENGKGNRD